MLTKENTKTYSPKIFVDGLRYKKQAPKTRRKKEWLFGARQKIKSIKTGIVLIIFVSVFAMAMYTTYTTIVRTTTVRAGIYNLYATLCLGGWENTHLASGAPEVGVKDGAIIFTADNSARLDMSTHHAQIYCGGFSGDILEGTIPKKIVVKFSWAVKHPPQPPVSAEAMPEEYSAPTTEDIIYSATDAIKHLEETADEPAKEVFEEITESEPAPVSTEEGVFSADEAEMSIEPAPEPEPASVPAPLSYGLIEVFYTLDGVEWKSLGFVQEDAFSGASFEIPIEEASDWEDISKIQIGIRSVPVLDSVAPVIYLDSVWIEVEYQKVVEYQEVSEDPFIPPGEKEGDIILSEVLYEEMIAVDEDIVISEPLNPQLPPIRERRFDKKVRIAKDARHSCAAKNFRIDISGQSQTIAEFTLDGDRSDIEAIKIGSLPLGIDITFLNNADHEYSPARKDDVFVLQIINQLGSQKGDFNIPILYTSGNETMICQLNVINMD